MAAPLPLRFHNIGVITDELNQDRRRIPIKPRIVMRVGAAGQKIREIDLTKEQLHTLLIQAAVALDRFDKET